MRKNHRFSMFTENTLKEFPHCETFSSIISTGIIQYAGQVLCKEQKDSLSNRWKNPLQIQMNLGHIIEMHRILEV